MLRGVLERSMQGPRFTEQSGQLVRFVTSASGRPVPP